MTQQAENNCASIQRRILYDAGQQPVVVAAVPDLVGFLGDGGGALLVLPQGVELCETTES